MGEIFFRRHSKNQTIAFFQSEFSMPIFIYLNKIAFCCFCALILSVSGFAQNGDLQRDLSDSFSEYKLSRLDANAAYRNANARQALTIPTTAGNFDLNIMPHDLRTRNYRAEETTANGNFAVEKSAVTTFKGKVSGEIESEVRLTLDGAKIEGYFSTANGRKFFVEPASHYSKFAKTGDFVVFDEKDFIKEKGFECLSELGEKIERGREIIGTRESATSTLRVIEMATEADYAFVGELGGAAQANNEILSILNIVEGSYESQLGLSFDVVFQHAWSTPDPYDGTNASATLLSFKNFWNANYPTASVPRDLAHIWTSRSNLTGLGTSYLNTVCRAPTAAYGLSGRLNFGTVQYALSAHEIGHSLNANHVGLAQGCDNTIMIPIVSNLTPLDFCQYSRSEIGNFVATSGGCLSERILNSKTKFDYDGDGKADLSVFRPASGIWYLNQTSAGVASAAFGVSSDKIVPGDYDGDGKTDLAVYRSGIWYLQRSTAGFAGVAFGDSNDIPVPADYDGDGKTDLAVFRPANGTWYIQASRAGFSGVSFGQRGDIPLPADFDGDGKADINVFRPSNGGWYRLNSVNNQFYGTSFGQNGDKPLAADFDGDGKADLTVFRPANGAWYRITSSNNLFTATLFGAAGDVPTPADYDGDGKTDISVFRPETGVWYRYNSGSGAFAAYYFGASADVPTPAFYLQ